jgi:predicted enzyme related to lactoylglutathione lyase
MYANRSRRGTRQRRLRVIEGVGQVIIEVANQDRAVEFWTNTVGFELARDAPYGDGRRWIEVRTRDKAVVLVLSLGGSSRSAAPEELPTSNVFFYCEDLPRTHEDLSARGVAFPQPPIEQPWGSWSMFEDLEGNRYALVPRSSLR